MDCIQALKSMRLMRKLLPKLLSNNSSDALLKQNLSVVMKSLIRAPFVTGRGDLIFAKSIPIDKLTGQPDYVLLCGTSRDLDSSPMRQFTSRVRQLFIFSVYSLITKVRHLVHVLIENNKLVPQLLEQSFSEWSSATHSDFACSSLLSALLDLVTTVEFSERTGKGYIGIECSYFPCQTHQILSVSLMYGDEPVTFLLNCMMGLMITPTHNQGPISIPMNQLQSVTKTKDGFTITMSEPGITIHCSNMACLHFILLGREAMHFTTPNTLVQTQCIEALNNALEGNLVELDIFCSEDWKSNVAEYQQLRLDLVQSLEATLPKTVKNTVETWSEDQPGLSWKLTHICDVFQAMVGMESKRLDGLLVSSGAISAMLQWFKFNHSNVVCSRITQMLLFYITDPNGKRSRKCPVITRLMQELPTLLLDCVIQPPHRDLISAETQHLAVGLFVLVHTKGSVVQCNTTFQPGHAVRCSNLWHFIFDAIVDCKTKQTKYFIDLNNSGFERVASAFSTIIRHCVMDWHKGTCVLTHLGNHPEHVDFYIDHLYNDDFMIALIRLIFCDHAMT
ncbi:hypothetical protein THRCLA_11393, partial [Thraustotheca clavata]